MLGKLAHNLRSSNSRLLSTYSLVATSAKCTNLHYSTLLRPIRLILCPQATQLLTEFHVCMTQFVLHNSFQDRKRIIILTKPVKPHGCSRTLIEQIQHLSSVNVQQFYSTALQSAVLVLTPTNKWSSLAQLQARQCLQSVPGVPPREGNVMNWFNWAPHGVLKQVARLVPSSECAEAHDGATGLKTHQTSLKKWVFRGVNLTTI